ncbi:OmpA family protein [Marinomonas mediterranea]|uniref:OmpA family protein n=1 Tax=Marinomonas mediterranea TaxID=119864 RepID=UPI00234C012D|nr:OmpA family protein [Marinomonas mediterranea]WCN12551.1 OmpA family protein [Marinomonas mediterranea]
MKLTRILIPVLMAGASLAYGENNLDKVDQVYLGIDIGITEGERDDSFATGKIGYQLSDVWGIEAGYLNSLDNDAPKDAINLSALYYFNHFEDTSIFAKGLIQNDDEVTLGIGIGLQHFVYPNVSISPLLSYLQNDEGGEVVGQVGLNYFFGKTNSKPKDADNDGVIDQKDQCPNSAPNASVDMSGCEEKATSKPTVVDMPKKVDSDGDGIYDSVDQCPNTPANNEVNDLGCTLPNDNDQDGVLSNLDQCPTTPANTAVDDKGCAVVLDTDSDNDGVMDTSDSCPNTPAGFSVNSEGCTLYDLQTEEVQLEIRFANNSSEVKSESLPVLEEFATAINSYDLKNVEVQGHSSLDGSASYNLRLSEARAQSVADVLVKQFGVDASVITAKGYGETQPVINEISNEANMVNRRVVAVIQYEDKKAVQQ